MSGKPSRSLAGLLHHDAAPGVLLMLAMAAALVVANSGAAWYPGLLEIPATVGIGEWILHKPLLLWINDGLMAVFFLLVGLELKREILYGELSDVRKVVLPLCGALGGIAIPSGIYAYINWGDAAAMNGWAIPAATDIAFALGILAILGRRVPVALKILLASVAVIDDLAAIGIIALFYTSDLSLLSLGTALVLMSGLFLLNRFGVKSAAPYLLLGAALWLAVLKSGVHATLAGVVLAVFIPARRKEEGVGSSLLDRMEAGLHPWVVFAILPAFAFANAGVPIAGLTPAALLEPVPLGIALGLFLGKPLGVFLASWLAVKAGLARLPAAVNWAHVFGVSVLCGIGFTMSLFIGSLAFEASGGPDYAVDDRLGILAGSFLSAALGVVILVMTHRFVTMGENRSGGVVSKVTGGIEAAKASRIFAPLAIAGGVVAVTAILTMARNAGKEDSVPGNPLEHKLHLPGTMMAGMSAEELSGAPVLCPDFSEFSNTP